MMKLPTWTRSWTWPRPSSLGLLLLGVWLIALGASQLLGFQIPYAHVVLPALAIAAGIAMVFEVRTTTLLLCVALVCAVALIVFLLR
ncbi:MAG: hypothetical protein HYS13_15595 [Planctomycetia bacterium]|nr:hypothetical protein [Planctomycetia bacterium]